jgi:hypothetical protein
LDRVTHDSSFLDFRVNSGIEHFPDHRAVGNIVEVTGSSSQKYGYFNGKSYVVFEDAMFASQFALKMMVKPHALGGTLFSGTIRVRESQFVNDPMIKDDTTDTYDPVESSRT